MFGSKSCVMANLPGKTNGLSDSATPSESGQPLPSQDGSGSVKALACFRHIKLQSLKPEGIRDDNEQEYFSTHPGHYGDSKPVMFVDNADLFSRGEDMTIHQLLVLSAAAFALSTLPSRASPCAHDIDRAWVEVGAKIQARIGSGRSAPQSTIALLHHQPTP
jgi:hypothetical protein